MFSRVNRSRTVILLLIELVLLVASVPNGADVQCAFNRSGKLCGACENNLSLVSCSSQCQECSNSFVSLIISFALAGILILNVTVASGTINGLIFCATQGATPFDMPNILIIFISWINLDLGIEMCLYNGWNSTTKVLLQLAFDPTYILLITIMIIISEYSIRFAATLIGKNDPVATLLITIVMIIISTNEYSIRFARFIVKLSKLLAVAILCLPIIITGTIIIILGSVYTVLIFIGQWSQRCGIRRFLGWVNNPKYNEFIKQYHVPFNPKHRYWVGFLLLARIFHYLVSAFVPDAAVLLSVICIVAGLVLLKQVNTVRTYKNWLLNTLEFSFLINLIILAAATYFVGDNGGNQIALGATSLGISLITFLGILVYHCYMYMYICKSQNARFVYNSRPLYPTLTESHYMVLTEVLTSNDDYSQLNQPPAPHRMVIPNHYDPPVIVPAVRHDQPREPDLDILDPITTDDYRQLNQPPAPRPRQVPTTTVIDRPDQVVDDPHRRAIKEMEERH